MYLFKGLHFMSLPVPFFHVLQSGPMADRKLPDVAGVAGLDVSFEADVDNDDTDDDIVSPYMVFQPKYGVSVPKVDFHSFNVTRKEASIDVSQLVCYVCTLTETCTHIS